MIQFQYSEEVKNALHVSGSVARECLNEHIYPGHLLKAILHKDFGLPDFIEEIKKDYYYLVDWAEARTKLYPKTSKIPENPTMDDSAIAVFSEADNYRLKFGKNLIDPICILASLCTPGVGFTYEQLKSFPLSHNEILDYFSKQTDIGGKSNAGSAIQSPKSGGKASALFKYCFDKSLLVQQGMVPPVVGMEKEILSIIEALGRKFKSNVLILGESGVGKTSLINGLAHRLSDKIIPGFLTDIKLFELDASSLVAGANYKGEIEDRFKTTVDEIRSFEKAILIIESLDNVADKHNTLNSIAGILKQELTKGEIIIIGTSSVDGYTKHIESDKELSRKFENLKLEEPNEEKTFRIIKEIKNSYEVHHNLKVEDNEIKTAIKLAKRYLTERCLPDSALDLIDRTLSLINTMNEISEKEIEQLKNKLQSIEQKKQTETSVGLTIELGWLYEEIHNRISYSLLSGIEDHTELDSLTSTEDKFQFLTAFLDKLETLAHTKKESIDESDISIIVAQLTGIPLGKIKTKERDKLINAEEIIKSRVVGQDHAIKTIIEAIYESRSGLNKKGQPIGSFFFLGPTGTGKTELAKALAEFLFQDESSMIRFDMSEFKEEHSAALLYGAPPGYVGYEEGGVLVNKIRQKPYSVVLFDEIEKAHTSVFDIFLQILDEGKLHDRLGKEGNFSNALVLFTSNIGSDYIFKTFEQKKIPPANELMEIMSRHFRPEFLGRLTEIIPFAPISEEIVMTIFDINMKSLYKALDELGIELVIRPEAKKNLAASGYSIQFGARPIIGVIRNRIRRPLSKLIISGKISKGSKVVLQYNKSEYNWSY
ncbi:MAG: ATP-dependent Clp protease ATP-binding subunit [Bacteroidota bacterium]